MCGLKDCLPKYPFFFWRVMKRKISSDDNLRRMHIHIVSKCFCCDTSECESMEHLFQTAPIAKKLWRQFALCAGICLDGGQLLPSINKWWNFEANSKLQYVMKAVPTILMWELWKRRNAIKHGKDVCFSRLHNN